MSGKRGRGRGRGTQRQGQDPAQQGTPTTTSAAATATTATTTTAGAPTGLRRSQRVQNQAQQQAVPATTIAATSTSATTSKGKQPKKQAVGKGKAPVTTTTAPSTKPTAQVATPSTSGTQATKLTAPIPSMSGTPATAGSGKRKRTEEVSSSSSGSSSGPSTPLMDIVSVDDKKFEKSSPVLGARKVGELCHDFTSLIPLDAPALPDEMAVLEKKGFKFNVTNLREIGSGTYGVVYGCTYNWKGKDGKERQKDLACKKVAISHPSGRLDYTIKGVENQMLNEMRISELFIDNPDKHVTKHELVYKIYSTKTLFKYENPINQLIFMELCEGNLKDFVTENFGYSTANDFSGAPTDFINKIWVSHVCQGLDFLHNYDKMAKWEKENRWIAIIHNDLKQSNILYQLRNGRVKFMICDFGLSDIYNYRSNRSRINTPMMTKNTTGTERYLSPEVRELKEGLKDPTFQGYKFEARKKEVYAVGIMLHDLLIGYAQTGKHYSLMDDWRENKLLKKLWKDYTESPLFSHVSPQCFDLLFLLLAPDPNRRPFIQDEMFMHPWLNDPDPRLKPSFVDFQSELPQTKKFPTRIP